MLSIRRLLDRPGPKRALSVGLVAAAVAAPAGVALVWGDGHPAFVPPAFGGAAWLASPSVGLVTLVDGPSEQVSASVGIRSAAGDAVEVTQQGPSAFVANSTTGTVTRVDGATYEATGPTQFAEAGQGVEVMSGGSRVYVVDAGRRTASTVDAESLGVVDELSLAARPGPSQSVVDGEGRLWVVDSERGGLTWVGAGKGVAPDVSDPSTKIVLVQGDPVLVDPERGRVGRVGDHGEVDTWSCLEVRPDDDVEVAGSSTGPAVYAAVTQTGTLVRAGLDRDDCASTVEVGRPGDAFGALAVVGRFVLVPNLATGSVHVVDTGDDSAVELPLIEQGNAFELVHKDGLVFYNDLESEVAGVLTLEGGTWTKSASIQKYDPADPGADVVQPVGSDPKPLTPKEPDKQAGDRPPGPEPTASPSAGPAPAPSRSGPPVPGPRAPQAPATGPTPGGGAATPGPTGGVTPTTGPLVVGELQTDPAVIGVDGVTTVTASLDNAAGARWQLTVRAADCDYEMTTALTALTPDQVATERFSTEVGPLSSECLGDHHVELQVSGPTGAVTRETTIEVVSDPSGTPAIDSLTCDPVNPGTTDAVTCTATESVVGSSATWLWSVTDTDRGEQVLAPSARRAGEPFVTALSRPSRYEVTLTVRYKGVETSRSTALASSVTVPGVEDRTLAEATAALAELGLGRTTSTVRSNTVPAGSVVAGTPGAGATAVVGDVVHLTVSEGPNAPVDLLANAPSASWRSGAGALPWNGNDGDVRGFALRRSGWVLEDGSAPTVLETHPEWVSGGWIEGRYDLPAPVLAGDRFWSQVGFLAVASPPSAGEATFEVRAVMGDGTESGPLVRQYDIGADGTLRTLDMDLTPVAGAVGLVLRVEAGPRANQDWAVWVSPRVGR